MGKEIIIVFLLTFCLISSISLADPIEIEKGSSKEVYFQIENNNNQSLYYTIYSTDGLHSIIFYYSQILLQPYEQKYIKVIIFPGKQVEAKTYDVTLVAESNKDRITKNLDVRVLEKQKEVELQEFSFNERDLKVNFEVWNYYDMVLEIYKDGKMVQKFNKRISPSDNKLEETLDLGLGNYKMELKLFKDHEVVFSEEKSYQKTSKIIKEEKKWDYFITYGKRINYYNEGDISEEKQYTLYVDKSQDPFFSASGYDKKIDMGERYKYVWEFEIGPKQTYTITYSHNYSIIAVLLIAIGFLGFMLYWVTKKDLKLNKTAITKVKEIKERHEIKICLEVLNKTNHEITDITLEEFVPPIFDLKKEFSVIKPKKIVKDKQDRKLVWEISRIEPKETRVFTYKVTPRIGVSGKYSFPLARIKYKRESISKLVFSNSLSVK